MDNIIGGIATRRKGKRHPNVGATRPDRPCPGDDNDDGHDGDYGDEGDGDGDDGDDLQLFQGSLRYRSMLIRICAHLLDKNQQED